MLQNNHIRALRLINSTIDTLQLNLSNYTVLTEVGSGSYLYSPIIAAMAGAKQIFAWTRDSMYGKGEEIIDSCNLLLKRIAMSERVEFSNCKRPVEHVQQADIVTNSGFVRPLNSEFLQYLKPGAVIPLMFEAWELREKDVDINYCKKKGIRVAGTNESHTSILIFEYVKPLVLKLALSAGMEVLHNNIIVWSSDNFGKYSLEAFKAAGAKSVILTTDVEELYMKAPEADFVFIADYYQQAQIIGVKGLFDLNKLKEANPALAFVHLYGSIDHQFAKEMQFTIYPDKIGYPQVMTETLGFVGLKPVLSLQAAGLKVGQELLENSISDLSQPVSFQLHT